MALADTAPRPPYSQRAVATLRFALALSLALNIFVLGGVAFDLWQKPLAAAPSAVPIAPPPPGRRIELLGETLGLTPEASAPLARFRGAVTGSVAGTRRANRPLIDAFWSEAVKPSPDPDRLQNLLDRILDNRHGLQRQVEAQFLEFLAQLPPDKRALLAASAANHTDPGGQFVRGIVGN
jgi:uncharacterized membrane protein